MAALSALAGTAVWALTRSRAEYTTTAGLLATIGAAVTTLVILPRPDPDHNTMRAPEQHPTTTATSPTTTTANFHEPPAATTTPRNPLDKTAPETTLRTSRPGDRSVTQQDIPADTTTQEQDHEQREDDGGESREPSPSDRRTQCLDVPPKPTTDIAACVAAVANLIGEVQL